VAVVEVVHKLLDLVVLVEVKVIVDHPALVLLVKVMMEVLMLKEVVLAVVVLVQ
tara:strand:- start:247 stop:408 length:162 start_codon:yes stop_codon:yes gene_type:complete